MPALKIIDYTRLAPPEYAARLAAFGDPVLDSLYEQSKAKPEPKRRIVASQPERCPGCGRTAILVREDHALTCASCHDETAELVRNPRW